MSRRVITGVLFAGVLACGAWAVYTVEKDRASLRSAMAADVPPEVTQPARASASAGAGGSSSPDHHGATPRSSGSVDSKSADPVPAESGPIKPGEILDYSANVSKLNSVATLRLQVAARSDFLGKPAWHIQAFAHTQNPLRMVFELDDRFDSYSDVDALTSFQYEMHLSERGQKVDSVQRMTVTGKEPASAGASQTHVLPGTRDPLGMMQFLRTVDWSKTPEIHGPVYDGHKLYEVRASLAGSESVTVAAGSFNTSKVNLRVFDNGAEMKDAKFSLYLSKDAARTPVLLEAVLPFADARVELTKFR